MLTEKRYEVVLNLLNEKNSVTVTEIKELLGISESTIRRDLAALDKAGKPDSCRNQYQYEQGKPKRTSSRKRKHDPVTP